MKTKKDTLLKLSGSMTISSTVNYTSGIPYRLPPFSWTFSWYPVLTFKGITIPTRIILGKQDSYFHQPFNQIGISPRYKWITLHLGYRNLHFSPFTLAGHTFLGTGLELNPGKWKIALMYGRLRKAIGEDPLLPYQIQATYKRLGYGGNIGYGNKDNFIAFSFFRARDDTASLENNTFNTNNQLTPSDNLVAGIRSKQQVGKKNSAMKWVWETDWAASAYNSDYRAQSIASGKLGLWKPFTGLFQPTHSMRLATAGQIALTLKQKDYATILRYRRIDPDYRSMGAYYFQTDVESITLEPSWKSCKKKLSIQSTLGFERNNLAQQRNATTKRTVGSLNLSFNPTPKYALDVQIANYGCTQQTGRNPLNDTIRMVQANRNICIVNRYLSASETKTQSLTFMLNYQLVSDLNAFTSPVNNSQVFNLQLAYDKVLIPAGLTMNTSIQHTTLTNNSGRNTISGITGSMTKNLKANKLSYHKAVSIFFTSFHPNGTVVSNEQRSKMLTLNAGIQDKINRHHQWNIDVNGLFNWAPANQSFSEITGRLAYTYHF
ncbi:hypothetical protein OCK74_22770 [Chitinophagaceae bacterium LB-8]|uniref:Uncharacterized protein n=1 Tax=Paraflavisolibacter caeni TaxID=2982496 RepID=A0A9X3B9Z2_9BACT|nr:hypothetical protein [Paraflavisolibacter caeni]MCU7551961.1 hypothetical protein [Paraflavisolibacter caeni]